METTILADFPALERLHISQDSDNVIESVPGLVKVSDTSLASTASTRSNCSEAAGDGDDFSEGFSSHPSKTDLINAMGSDLESPGEMRSPCRVSWGEVQVQTYGLCPGIHPDCVQGPALTIDWEPFSRKEYDIDVFEGKRRRRRTDEQLRIPFLQRHRLLKRSGYDDDELFQVQEQSRALRKQRESTLKSLKFEKVVEARQSLLRKLGRTFYPKKRLATKY